VNTPNILITGATGFVGAELLDRLRDTGRVRVIVRDASKLEQTDDIDVYEGDLSDADAVRGALEGIETAYYLVHSMEPGDDDDDFASQDRELATVFLRAAEAEGVARIVYLGGVQPDGETSKHLQSRKEVEDVLGSGVPDLVALRASMVIGAQSDSFRTLAQIVDRLPVLALPTWRTARTQPIAIADVIEALAAAPGTPPGAYEVGGPDEVSIEQMCETIGDLLGDQPPSVHLPFSSSRLEGAAASVVADSSREVLEPLLEGMHDDLRVSDNQLESAFGVRPTPFRAAAKDALARINGDL
jgi:uncharacterized protein YbjT (DUF2867 family)